MDDTLIQLVKASDEVFTKEYNIEYFGIFNDLEDFCKEVIKRENLSIAPELIPYLEWEQLSRELAKKGYYFEVVDIHLRKADQQDELFIGSKHTPKQ